MQEATIYEKSIVFESFTDPLERLISSMIIYGSHYYAVPSVDEMVREFINHENIIHSDQLERVLGVLNEDLMREIVYGPHGYYVCAG